MQCKQTANERHSLAKQRHRVFKVVLLYLKTSCYTRFFLYFKLKMPVGFKMNFILTARDSNCCLCKRYSESNLLH